MTAFTGVAFTRLEALLYPLLRLPQLKRACIDSTGMGTQLAEQAREHFGWKAARRARLITAKTGFDMGVPVNELNRVLDLGFKNLPHGDTCYLPTNLQPVGTESVARNGQSQSEVVRPD